MYQDALDTIHSVWAELSGCPEGFSAPGVHLSVAAHVVAPIGWIGSVCLGDSAVVAIRPDESEAAAHVTTSTLKLSDLRDREAAEAVFGAIDDTLGPAVLAFALSPVDTSTNGRSVIGPVPFSDARVSVLTEAATPEEVDESAIEDLASGLFVALNEDGHPVAASGYSPVVNKLAHLGVLTATEERGRGYGHQAAVAAITHAQQACLIPQWRAALTNTASIAIAKRLGLTILGRQFSFRLVATPCN